MPQQFYNIFEDPPAQPGPPSGPKPASPAAPQKASKFTNIFANEQAGPPPVPEEPKISGSWLTTSVLKHATGATATEKYEDLVKTLLPSSLQKAKGDSWVGRFGVELGKAGPELLDFASSPVGMAMIAAHMFPATAPFALVIDMAMGVMGGVQSFPLVGKALSDGTPESWAEAIKSMAMSAAMVGGAGGKLLASRAGRYRAVPLAERNALRESLTKAPDAEKIPMLEKAKQEAAPARGMQKLYDITGFKTLAKALQVPKPMLLQASADVVFDRSVLIAERNFDVNRKLYDFKREIPMADRDVRKLGYVIQGDATPAEVGLSKAGQSALAKLRDFTKEQDKLLYEAYGDDISLLDPEHYLTQVWSPDSVAASRARGWSLPDPKEGPGMTATAGARPARVNRTLMNDPYLKQRTIKSYKVGIEELGLEPRYNDVLDILKRRADFATQAIANRRMAGMLRDLGVVVTEDEFHSMGLDAWKEATQTPALNRATYAGNTKEGMPYFERRPVYVHPDFEAAVNSVFGKGVQIPGFAAMDTIRALAKKSMFSMNLFHHNSLSEQGHAMFAMRKPLPGLGQKTAPGVRAGDALRQTWLFNPHFQSGVKSAFMEAVGREGDRPPIMRVEPHLIHDALRAGLNLNSEEREAWMLDKIKDMSVSHNWITKAVGGVAKPFVKLMEGHDSALWDFFHPGAQLDAYYTILADEIPKLGKNATPAMLADLERTTANHVNNATGALSFERMLISPVARQALNWIFLAPAWSLSNLAVFSTGFESAAGARIARKYLTGAAMSWFTSAQLMNYALTGHYKTEDRHGVKGPHFTWDNPGAPAHIGGIYYGLTENFANISLGYDSERKPRYLVLDKAHREAVSWLMNPLETAGNKLSAPVRLSMVLATGHSPGSGFQEIDSRASQTEQAAQGAIAAAQSFGMPMVARDPLLKAGHALFPGHIKGPISTTAGPFDPLSILTSSFPTKKGMTLTTAVKAYAAAIDAGRPDKRIELLHNAGLNGVDPRQVIQTYNRDYRNKQKQIRGPAVQYDTFGNKVKR